VSGSPILVPGLNQTRPEYYVCRIAANDRSGTVGDIDAGLQRTAAFEEEADAFKVKESATKSSQNGHKQPFARLQKQAKRNPPK